jgi:hypothetical protein
MEIIHPERRPSISHFDHFVGKVAGALFSVVTEGRSQDHVFLLPALTFKVRSCLSRHPSLLNSPPEHVHQIARELQLNTENTLRFFEYGQEHIEYLRPEIETTLLDILWRTFGEAG